MRTAYRNTTALITIFSLSVPTLAVGQNGKPGCEEGTLGVTAELAASAGLALTDAQLAALDTGKAGEDMNLVKIKGQPTLCMTAEDLLGIGATQDQKAMLMVAPEAAPEAPAEAEESAESAPEVAEEPAETAEAEPETDPAPAEAVTEQAEAEVEAEAEAEQAEAEVEAETDPVEIAKEAAPEPRPEEVEAEAAETATLREDVRQAVEAASTEAEAELAAEQEAIEARAVEEAAPEQQAEAAEQEAPEQTAAAADDAAEAADVEETVVTEETSRSSTEEFLDKMQTSATAESASSGDKGLSDFEKALLVGLGAVVIGKTLGDNDDARVVSKSQDRVVVLQDGRYRVIRDDNELIERPGSTVRRETFDDGSTRTIVTREDGVQIVTIRDPELRVLRRVRIDTDGTRTVLIDDTGDVAPVNVVDLPDPVETEATTSASDVEALRRALQEANAQDRRFALYQVRNIEKVRKLAPAIALDAINFRTGSAVIDAEEARELSDLGTLIADFIAERPNEIFLIEGHTDAVGNAAMNLALSDRRAESVALALTEYFGVPPENLVVQGYGESDLQVRTLEAERANRRAAVRRITPLISGGS